MDDPDADCLDYVDDFYFSALEAEEDLLPVSDEKYADALQFQEVVLASVVFSIRQMPPPPPAASNRFPPPPSPYSTGPLEGEPSGFVCGICMEPKEISDTFQNRSCSHRFCIDCTRRHLTVRIQENATRVRCPEAGCKSSIDAECCQSIVPVHVFERWSAVLSESAISARNRIYCPFRDCSALLEIDGITVIVQAECPSCNRLFCARCKTPWHADLACEDYQLGDEGRNDILLKNLAKDKKWARCPRCKFFVERAEGCSHMTCRCSFEFCYICGGRWTDGHHACKY
ncbi:unnamed protein product [Victoria cruziana]